eukprot:Nk52_evm1s305 gene=Nk52_evmTU1s305
MEGQLDVNQWLNDIPKITRMWFVGTIAVSIACAYLVSPYYVVLQYEPVFYRFEIWRLVLNPFFHPLRMPFLIHLYFMYSYSQRMETDVLPDRGDYLWMLLFCYLTAFTVSFLFIPRIVFFSPILVGSVLYVWSQMHRDMIVTFFFGLRFKAMFLPWVMLLFDIILMQDPFTTLLGIACGHLYYFLKYAYPDMSGVALLETPRVWKSWFSQTPGSERGAVQGFNQSSRIRARNNDDQAPSSIWGSGRSLGSS